MSDPQWEKLVDAWQAADTVSLPDLKRTMSRRTLFIWALTALDTVVTLAALVYVTWNLLEHPGPGSIGLLVGVVAFLILGWVITLRVRAGTWRAESSAPLAMLDLNIRRVRASIRLATIGQWAFAVGLVAGIVARLSQWKPGFVELGDTTQTVLRIVFAILVAAYLFGAQWFKQRKRRELEALVTMREQMVSAD